MTAPILEIRNLSKNFGSLRVTNDVSLDIAPGARHALIGPNGAGKTTLVGLLCGTLRQDAGTIHIAGKDVSKMPAYRRVRAGLGRTFQITNLFNDLTVMENLFITLSERDGLSSRMFTLANRQKQVLDEAMEVLDTLGLADRRNARLNEIAYGEQRLVEVAFALCLKPKILLLDEPAAGIPSNEMSRVVDSIGKLPRDTAILFIEHDMAIVRQLADRASVLVEGTLVQTGETAAILASDEVKAVYLGHRKAAKGHEHA